MNNPTFESAMSKARIDLLKQDSMIFFASVVMSVSHTINNDQLTASTDGLSVTYNEDFFMKLTREERCFLVAHESMHIILEHCTSRHTGFDPKLWNDAGDYVINLMLTKAGLQMPKGGLLDRSFDNMSTVQVYRQLEQHGSPEPNKMGGQNLADLLPDVGMSQDKKEKIRQEVEDIVMRAKTEAEMQGQQPGNLTADLQRLFDRLTKPAIPWQRLLQRFFNALGKDDYSYRRPNRRYMPLDMYLPSVSSPTLGRIDFAIDTSGSVSQETFSYFISEVHHVLKRFKPEAIGVLQFDHELKSNDVIHTPKQLLDLKLIGGGGTNVTEAIEAFASNKAQAMFILTDGYLRTEKLPNPGKPIIWCIYDNSGFKPAFGEVIHFSMGDV